MRRDRAPARVGHHHEARQAVVFGAEPVAEPTAQARLTDHHVARVHLQATRCVRGRVGVHRADHAQLVGKTGGMRKEAADLETALTMLSECEWRLHQPPDRAAVGADRRWALIGRVVVSRERRLVVEGVDLARGAIHEQEDHALCACRKMRRLGRHQRWLCTRGRLRAAIRVAVRRRAGTGRKSRSETADQRGPIRRIRRPLARETPGASARTASDWG